MQLPPAAPLPLAPPVGPADPYTLYPWLLEPALRGHPDVRMSWHHDSGYARSSWDLWAPGRGGLSIIRDDTGYRWDGLSSVYRDMDRLSVQELSPDAVMTAVHLWLAGPPWASA